MKYVALAETLRGQIQAGKFPLGEKLPPERVLAKTYDVAYFTVRQSLGLLEKRGLITREHGRGTFVKAATQKTLIGVLCVPSLADEVSHFPRGLLKAIQAESEHGGEAFTCRCYDTLGYLDTEEDHRQSPSHQRLLSDLHHFSFGGVFEINESKGWRRPKEVSALPTVRFTGSYQQPDVSVDYRHFASESLSFLRQTGKEDIVYLRTLPDQPDVRADFSAIQELGMSPPRIEQFAAVCGGHSLEREAYEKTLQLVDEWRSTKRWPDALLISDDIGARGVALALSQKGVRVPTDLMLMTLACEGIEHHYGMPVVKWEVPLGDIARHLVRFLRERMQNPNAQLQPVTVAGRIRCEEIKANESRNSGT